MSIVLDASVTMHWCEPHGADADRKYARGVLEKLKDMAAVVPLIWSFEIANALRKMERQNVIDEAKCGAFVAFLNSLDVVPDPKSHPQALADTLHLARRFDLSAYDAAYLELAIRTGLPLATLDKALRDAAERAGVDLVK